MSLSHGLGHLSLPDFVDNLLAKELSIGFSFNSHSCWILNLQFVFINHFGWDSWHQSLSLRAIERCSIADLSLVETGFDQA